MSSDWTRDEMYAAMAELVEEKTLWAWLIAGFSNDSVWSGEEFLTSRPGLKIRLSREAVLPYFGRVKLCIHVFRASYQQMTEHTHTRPYCSYGLDGEMDARAWTYNPFGHQLGPYVSTVRPGVISGIAEPRVWHDLYTNGSEVMTVVVFGDVYDYADLDLAGVTPDQTFKVKKLTPPERKVYHRRAIRAYVKTRRPELVDQLPSLVPGW